MDVEVKGNTVYVDGAEYCRFEVEIDFYPFGFEERVKKVYSSNFGLVDRIKLERNRIVREAMRRAEFNALEELGKWYNEMKGNAETI